MHKLIAITFAALASCSKAADDCTAAIDHMMAVELAAVSPSDEALAKARRIKPAVIASCHETKWSAEITGCLKGAKTRAEGGKCTDKLRAVQAQALRAAQNR